MGGEEEGGVVLVMRMFMLEFVGGFEAYGVLGVGRGVGGVDGAGGL